MGGGKASAPSYLFLKKSSRFSSSFSSFKLFRLKVTLLFARGMQDVVEGLSKNETAPKREAEKLREDDW